MINIVLMTFTEQKGKFGKWSSSKTCTFVGFEYNFRTFSGT